MNRSLIFAAAVTLAGSLADAQSYSRRATFLGGNPDRGKCTVEVVVDGAADVIIRGDTATLRNLSGRPPEWRRFECSAPLPPNPVGFRFAGVDGRGRQELISDPRNGGTAVVRIEDRDNGAEGYTFDLFWDNRGAGYPAYGEYPRPAWGSGDVIRACQDAVREEARRRFGYGDIVFRGSTAEDNPGRRDWVSGAFEMRRRFGGVDRFRYSCSVSFEERVVRGVRIEPLEGGGWSNGYRREEDPDGDARPGDWRRR